MWNAADANIGFLQRLSCPHFGKRSNPNYNGRFQDFDDAKQCLVTHSIQ